MYVVYEHFEYRRKQSTSLRMLWSLPDTVSYMRALVKVAKQFKGSLFLYRGILSSSSMDQHSRSTVILRVVLPGRNMWNNLPLDIKISSRVPRRLRADLSVLWNRKKHAVEFVLYQHQTVVESTLIYSDVLRDFIFFARFAVNGDICVSSGRKNPLEEGLKQTGIFRELVGRLMWLANQTRPDIANEVRAVARNTTSPRKAHWKTAAGIFALTGILLWNIWFFRMVEYLMI